LGRQTGNAQAGEVSAHVGSDVRGILLALVEIYQRQKRREDAIDCLNKLRRLEPDDVVVKLSLAEILMEARLDDPNVCRRVVRLAEGVENEPKMYGKTALSDLQGAWQNLRDEVINAIPFPEWKRLPFHIDEATSWESVQNLEHMRKTILVIQNIAAQAEVPYDVMQWIRLVKENFDEVIAAIAEGEID